MICNIAENNISLIKDIIINYNECLINQDSVIVAGIPDKGFVQYIDSIVRESGIYGNKLKRAWGAHITIGRFLCNIANENIIRLLDIILDSIEVGVSTPVAIDIGYYILANGKFDLNVYKSIKFK